MMVLYCEKADVEGPGGDFTIPAAWSDAEVDAEIEEASRRVDLLTRDYWSSISRSFLLSGDNTDLLLTNSVTQLRIISITQIQYRSQYSASDNFDVDGEVVDEDTYVLTKSKRGIRRVGYSYGRGHALESGYSRIWVGGKNNYKLTAVFGHSTVPVGIKQATAYLVRERIAPQYLSNLVPPLSERFPDGYQYTAPQHTVVEATKPGLTGFSVVDSLLWPYVNKSPKMVVP